MYSDIFENEINCYPSLAFRQHVAVVLLPENAIFEERSAKFFLKTQFSAVIWT